VLGERLHQLGRSGARKVIDRILSSGVALAALSFVAAILIGAV
jgi:hypothetical protein